MERENGLSPLRKKEAMGGITVEAEDAKLAP